MVFVSLSSSYNTSFIFRGSAEAIIYIYPAHAVVDQPLSVVWRTSLFCIARTKLSRIDGSNHKANERMGKINNTLLISGLAFLHGIEAAHAFASTLQRVKNSLTNKEYTREELKIGIAGFYDRSSKLWEDVWGEVRISAC